MKHYLIAVYTVMIILWMLLSGIFGYYLRDWQFYKYDTPKFAQCVPMQAIEGLNNE